MIDQTSPQAGMIPVEKPRFLILVRHFIFRFANNDFLSFETERRESQMFLVAAIMMVAGVVAHQIFFKFLLLPASVKVTSIWPEKTHFLTYVMALTGIISIIIRDNLFLDRRDFQNLMVLPLTRSILFEAKFCSTLFFIILAAIAMNLLSTLVISFYLLEKLLTPPFYFVLIHIATSFLAVAFVFLAIAMIQGLLMVLLKGKLLRLVTSLIQTLMLIGFVSVFAWFPKVHSSLPEMKAADSLFLYLFPPCWFSGLHEWLAGSVDTLFGRQAMLVVLALLSSTLVYGVTLTASVKRYLTRSDFQGGAAILFEPLKRSFNRLKDIFLRNTVERGIYDFFVQSLRRSRKHQFYLLLIMSLPVGFVVSQIAYMYSRRGSQYLHEISLNMLIYPFLLGMALIGGIRILVELPVESNAHWLFQVTENRQLQLYSSGLKKALFCVAVLPLFIVFAVFYLLCWDTGPALLHSFYYLAVLILLTKLLFMNYRKVPFASVYNPGVVNLKATWPLFIICFLLYSFIFAILGLLLILKPQYNLLFYPAVFLFHLVIRRFESRYDGTGLVFVEESPPLMLSLNLGK